MPNPGGLVDSRRLILIVPGVLALACDGKATDSGGSGGDDGAVPIDEDGDGYVSAADGGDDCDDSDADIHPDAEEVCNDVDDNCDGDIDEGMRSTFYADEDGDGHGVPDTSVEACAPPRGHADNALDCDDTNALVSPDAVEVCDHVDNDCDEEVDEGVTTTFYQDTDADGFGDPDLPVEACEPGDARVDNADDCDDGDASVSPGSTEVTCDDVDNDCDTEVDEGGFLVPTDYATLQAAVDALPDGSEICVEPGTYAESLDLSGRTLGFVGKQGPGTTILDVGSSAPMLTVSGDSETFGAGDVTVSGFTISGGDFDATAADVEGGFAHVEGGTLHLDDILFTDHSGAQGSAWRLEGALVWGSNASIRLTDVDIDAVALEVAGTLRGGLVKAYSGELSMDSVSATAFSVVGASDCGGTSIYGGLVLAEQAELDLVSVGVSDSSIDLTCSGNTTVSGGWMRLYGVTGQATDLSIGNSTVDQVSPSLAYLLSTLSVTGEEEDSFSLDGIDISGNTWATDATTLSTVYSAITTEYANVSNLRVWSNAVNARSTSGTAGGISTLVDVRQGDLDHLDVRANALVGGRYVSSVVYVEAYERDVSVSNLVLAGNTQEAVTAYTLALELYAEYGDLAVRNGDIVGNSVDASSFSDPAWVYADAYGAEDSIDLVNLQIVDNVHSTDDAFYAVFAEGSGTRSLRYSNLTGSDLDESSWGDAPGTGGNISADPVYVDVSSTDPTLWDLGLQASSPAIDAGDPTVTDEDGTVSDMGAYGGPGGSTW